MVDFINEVEEELRSDKYNVLLRKFGPYIVGLLVIIVAVAGFMEYQKYASSKKARAASATYSEAVELADNGDLQASIKHFIALSEVAPAGYAGLSLSRAAGLKVQLGDFEGAVTLFDRSAQAFETRLHKDLSSLKAAYILMDLERYDDVKIRSAALDTSDAPFQDLAKELSAHASLKTGDTKTAKQNFTYLANTPGVLNGVKSRAKQAVSLINANETVPNLDADVKALPELEVVPAETETQKD
ncbi:MAG: hypothetical protein COA43_16485 [Robiginitomaculum sp.]|nr:MAG: hypothetical protein COA43_16485 [Robiginitomaculum sp.]